VTGIPFEQIQSVSLAQAERLLSEWFPHGRRVGKEFKIGNIQGDAGESLSINVTTGRWADFAGDHSGHDLIDLFAAVRHGGDRVAAARELGEKLGIVVNGKDIQPNAHGTTDDDWRPIMPAPADAPEPSEKQRRCDILHEYLDADDRLLCYVRRFDAKGDKRKVFVPLTYGTLNGKTGWHDKSPNAPKPLYRLNWLSHADHNAIVILCEGEKSADAAQRMFPDHIAMSWMGGARAVPYADLRPLHGRDVIIWPDNDAEGRKAAGELQRRLPRARVLKVDDLPDGFDAADLERNGCDDPLAWLEARLPREQPQPNPQPAPDDTEQKQQKPELRLRFGFGATHAEPMGTVVEGLLHAGSITLIYGPPKSGKSFLATDMALTIPSEQEDWMGHEIVKHGPMLYVACEGHAGFWKRLVANAKKRNWDHDTFPPGFILATGRPTLIRADGNGHTYAPDPSSILTALADAKVHDLNPVAIVIDTVFRSFGVGNVNASPDMNVYLSCVAALTDTGYAVALIHHEIKSGGTPAGSVSLIGGSDNIIHVWRENETSHRRFWQVEMAKDDAATEPRAFTLEVVPIGLDPDGRPASSCVVCDAGSAPEAATKKRGRPPSSNSDAAIMADLIYTELCNLLACPNDGEMVSIKPGSPPIRAVSRTKLRATINQAGILVPLPDGPDRKRVEVNNDKQVQRGINRLKKQGKAAANEQWIGTCL
jgi:hypothetical protein